jgi:Flp pilus assembly protein TadG
MNPRTRPSLSALWLSDASGATAIEFAFLAPLMLAILLGILQVALIWFAKTELFSATQTAARLVYTGQTSSTYNSQTKFLNALCANLPVIFQCNGVLINMTPQTSISAVSTASPTLSYDGSGAVTNHFVYNAGKNSDVMVLQVMYQFPVVAAQLFNFATQANGSLLLVATVVFQNEPQ